VRAYDAAGNAQDYFKNARAGLKLEKNEKGATEGDGVDDVVGPVRIEYPEDLHEAAKSDRRGPFWSSLGEPDVTTGPRPPYQRRDDWHISSTYTPEERAQVLKEEREEVERVAEQREAAEIEAAAKLAEAEEGSYEDFFAPKEFMKLEEGEIEWKELAPPQYPLPTTWQEYQAVQEKVRAIGESEDLREEAAKHGENLVEFYQTFKDILANGWAVKNNSDVEAAMEFMMAHKKKWAKK
jgi:hypothetical protein